MKLKFKMRRETLKDWHWMVSFRGQLVAAGHESDLKDAIEAMQHYSSKVLQSEFHALKEDD